MATQSMTFKVGEFNPETDQIPTPAKLKEIQDYTLNLRRKHPMWPPAKVMKKVMQKYDIKILPDAATGTTDTGE